MADLRENCIEWINGDDKFTFSFSQEKFINKIEKEKLKHPNDVEILARNSNGSIYGHMTLKALHLSIIEKTLTDEQRAASSERLAKVREGKANE